MSGRTAIRLCIVWRTLPRNGGRALFLFCPYCNTPRRFVCGWEWDSFSGWSNRVRQVSWCCRSCNRLRYSSEGGHLRGSGRGALGAMFRAAFGNLPRPKSWLPYVFTSPQEAAEAGLCTVDSWPCHLARMWPCRCGLLRFVCYFQVPPLLTSDKRFAELQPSVERACLSASATCPK